MEKHNIKDKKLPVGFTFSFPCQQTKLDEVNSNVNLLTYSTQHLEIQNVIKCLWLNCYSCSNNLPQCNSTTSPRLKLSTIMVFIVFLLSVFVYRAICWHGRSVSKPVGLREWMLSICSTKQLRNEEWVSSLASFTITLCNTLSCNWFIIMLSFNLGHIHCPLIDLCASPVSGLWRWHHGCSEWYRGNDDDLWLRWPALWSWHHHRYAVLFSSLGAIQSKLNDFWKEWDPMQNDQ